MGTIERASRIDLSTAGVALAYAFEATKGERPTDEYTHIVGVSAIPEMNESPEIIDSTTLDELTERVGVAGLKGLPSATGFTANYTEQLQNQWEDIMSKYNTAKGEGKRMWVAVVIPNMTKAFYYTVEPSPLGQPGIDVGAVISIQLYLTKTGEIQLETAPTSVVAWEAA